MRHAEGGKLNRYFGDTHPECWTYRPTENLPKHVILDANVILDFCYIRDGLGWLSISYLSRNGFRLYTSSRCISEAKQRVLSFCDVSLTMLVDLAIDQAPIEVLDSADLPVAVSAINRNDGHVAAVAAHLGGFVLSDDIPLNGQLNSTSMHCRTMREIVFESFLPHGAPLPLLVIGYGLADSMGHAFFKGIPHDDMCSDLEREWTFWEHATLGRLFYHSGRKQLIFSPAFGGRPLVMRCDLVPNSQLSALLNYRIRRSYTEITIKLKQSINSQDVSSTFRINVTPSANLEGVEFRVMNSFELGNGWKGNLQNFAYGPGRMSRENWSVCSSLVGVSPPNLTCDLTRSALALTRVYGDSAYIPDLKNVINLAKITMSNFYTD